MRARAIALLWLLGCGQPGAPAERADGPVSAIEGPGAGGATAGQTTPSDSLEPPRAKEPVAFSCEPSSRTQPADLRRLTMTQYRNTVRDLTQWALGDAALAQAALLAADLDALPEDRRQGTAQDPHGGYRRLDQALDQGHVDETFRVAGALAAALTARGPLAALVGECATSGDASDDEACVSDFIRRFGARALRRPLEADDEAFYRAVYGESPAPDPAAYADVISVMLSSPEMLYFVEHGDAEIEGAPGSYALAPHELASRLSYHFWQTLPDDALWQAAQDGSLLDPAVLAQQVARLIADERTRATMHELFSDLLHLDALPALDAHVGDPVFAAFAGGDLPGPELRAHVIDDALDMLDYYTWTEPSGLPALLTSERSFARGADLARIYGVLPWDGVSAPPALPAGQRAGLLTRAWFLVSGSPSTRPIQRGVFVRRELLCDELAPPPASANALPPEARPDATTRQLIEELTEQPGTPCATCHATFINPLGFAFEGFDALGRARGAQRVFDANGRELGALPVDTHSVPRVTQDDASASSGPADLTRLMLQSGKLEACLARNYFRFTFGRAEDLAADGCALERLRARLVESGRIRDMLEEVALLPELRERRFE